MAACLPTVLFYRVKSLPTSRSRPAPATSYQFRGDRPDKSGAELVTTDKQLARRPGSRRWGRGIAPQPPAESTPYRFRPMESDKSGEKRAESDTKTKSDAR